nr:MAG TPA: hypothetical protein [Caudoviricetes sp.]
MHHSTYRCYGVLFCLIGNIRSVYKVGDYIQCL